MAGHPFIMAVFLAHHMYGHTSRPRLISADRNCRPTGELVRAVVDVLAAGGLVGLPTETVYGLAADATNPRAVARIFAAKARPRFNPLIVHVDSIASAEALGRLNAQARRLVEVFWPGPLTVVVPGRADSRIADLVVAGHDTIGLRMPAPPLTRRLIAAFGRPLAAPSANRAGRISPTRAADVVEELGEKVDIVIDAGPATLGIESTIVDCTGTRPRVLRPGGLARAEMEALLGRTMEVATGASERVMAPGMLSSHYAPATTVRLDADSVLPGEALLAFGPALPRGAESAVAVRNLSPSGDVLEAAAHLFGHLRALDRAGARCIAVMPIPAEGLGEAISDRLRRAAAAR